MGAKQPKNLKERVLAAAQCVLQRDKVVSPLALLTQMSLLSPACVRQWEKGLLKHLEASIQGGPKKLARVFACFTEWAETNQMIPLQTRFHTSGRDGSHELHVMGGDQPERELFFRTCYAPADMTPRRLATLKTRLNKPPDLVVYLTVDKAATCSECQTHLPCGEFIFMEQKCCLCLVCADLDHLEFLPSGDAAMSRRSKKHSPLFAVVVQFNRRAKRYERRGLLVTPAAIERAELECLSDTDKRAVQRQRGAIRRAADDVQLVDAMIEQIRAQFPSCPQSEIAQIAAHTARRGSGCVGRSAAGRQLDQGALRLAVIAHIRHTHTPYDDLLMTGCPRRLARQKIAPQIDRQIAKWEAPHV
jgi:hypothetical protein